MKQRVLDKTIDSNLRFCDWLLFGLIRNRKFESIVLLYGLD